MKFYSHGDMKRPYFEGWYLKHQTKGGPSLALIPALHIDSSGQPSASLQVISNHGSWWLDYSETDFHPSEAPFRLQLGESTFSHHGVSLNITRPDLSLHGTLRYGAFTSLKSHIMGPFRLFPHMKAPVRGAMGRTIHESLCSTIRYRFRAGETPLFDHTDPRASFEYSDQAPKMGG